MSDFGKHYEDDESILLDRNDSEQENPSNDIKIKEIEVTKLNLTPGDVLAVKIYSNDIQEYELDILKSRLTTLFPNNKIMLFSMPTNGKIEMDVIKTEGE